MPGVSKYLKINKSNKGHRENEKQPISQDKDIMFYMRCKL